jgi:hypothetical protein
MNEELLKQVVASQSEKILYLALDVQALKTCLLNKKLISQEDYNAAVAKVHEESKQALETLRKQFETGKQN